VVAQHQGGSVEKPVLAGGNRVPWRPAAATGQSLRVT
jgi:hypothetical protein